MNIHSSAPVRQCLQLAIKVDFLNIMMKAKYVKNIYFTFWWVSYEHRWNMKFSKHIFQLSILKSFQLLIGHFYNLQHILEMWRVDIIQSHLTPRPLIFFHKAYSMAWLPLTLVKCPSANFRNWLLSLFSLG